jgi:hypothetical protein
MDMPAVNSYKDGVIARLHKGLQGLVKSRNITFIEGHGRLFYKDTGEVTFDTGLGSGSPKLGFFNPRKALNYTNGVKVIYNGGYDSIPAEIKLAALEMIKILYKGREGAKTVRLQGEDSTSQDLSLDGFPPQVRRVLSLYRLPL